MGAIVGVPVAAIAYFFLRRSARRSSTSSPTLPNDLGFDCDAELVAGAAARRSAGCSSRSRSSYLPGTGGHTPAEGFKTGGAAPPIELPGIVLAAFATLSLGVVLGPEAPLIAIGSGLGVLAVHLIKKDAPEHGRRR